jgi:hypothetical protein
LAIVKKIGYSNPHALATVDDLGCNALGIACEVSSSASLIDELATLNYVM